MDRTAPLIRTFGRTRSRTLKPLPAARLAGMLPGFATPGGAFEPRDLTDCTAVWLEIGFGGGEHLCGQAALQPDILFLGAEPFVNGVASALGHIERIGLGNVRIHAGDGRDLMAALPSGCIDRLFMLFPDPWPKSRHHKRRLISVEFLCEAARVLRTGGGFRFATDWADYADWTLRLCQGSPDFHWTAEVADDWRKPPSDHHTTRYETKRLGDCEPVWLDFVRS